MGKALFHPIELIPKMNMLATDPMHRLVVCRSGFILFCRRMKKPFHNDVMDDYLASLGLWRKPTAKDGSCLFRAVAEQVIRYAFFR